MTNSSNRRNPIIYVICLVGCLIALSVCLLVLPIQHAPAIAVAKLTGVAQQMRDDPKEWLMNERDVSALVKDVRQGAIAVAGLADDCVLVATKQGDHYFVADTRSGRVSDILLNTYRNNDAPTFQIVQLDGVKRIRHGAEATFVSSVSMVRDMLGIIVPLAFVIGLLVYLKQQHGESGFNLVKDTGVRFDDVIGADEAKGALQDVTTYLRNPKAFAAIGARPPRGVLMIGGPGVGKTRLAQALAGESRANFINVSGSDFTAMFYGMGTLKVKRLFKTARKRAPCIVFIDEADGIGARTKTSNGGSAEQEMNRVVNQILVEMDGFKVDTGVIVVAATNLPDNLDKALLRPGRFDRRVDVALPDVTQRADIFHLYAKGIEVSGAVDFDQLGRLTMGLSPADIAYIVNHAALIALRAGKKAADMADFAEAIETSRMGEGNKAAKALRADERHRVAVHEGGHAVVAVARGFGRVEKVTIQSRGQALGVTLVTHDEDRKLMTRSELENRIMMLLGGRCAELVQSGQASSGAASDLEECTRLALGMETSYGLGQRGSLLNLHAVAHHPALAQIEMGRAMEAANTYLRTLEQRTLALLTELRPALEEVTHALLDDETISGDRVVAAIAKAQAVPVARAAA
jgi:cell division protease FtsH